GVPAVTDELQARGLAGADVVIECTGRPDVWAAAPQLARVGGQVLLFGGLAGGAEVAFSARRIHYDEVTLLGSFHYTPDDVVEAQRLLASGEMKLGGLITGVRPLSELLQAFEELERGEGVKFALRPEASPA
ncbi:MAG: zinc-binding dehydrogenase, partial [Limnochordales bacterium]